MSPFTAWPTTPYSRGSMSLRSISMPGLKFQHKANRSKLFCGQFPLCQVQKELAGQKTSGLTTEKAACKQTQPKSQSHVAKFPFSLFCCWRVCPSIFLIFIAYYYTIISFKIKTEEATAFYLLSTAMLLEI